MAGLEGNPFAVLTFIAAPAILTNASSVLALGTSNRFGRNVDRSRQLIKMLEGRDPATDSEAALYVRLLDRTQRRAHLLMWAMSFFYFAIGCFAAGSLTSLVGAILATTDYWIMRPVLFIALFAGVAGLAALIAGGALLVRETHLALATITEENAYYQEHYQAKLPATS